MAYTKADVIWSGYCDIKTHFKDVHLVIHYFLRACMQWFEVQRNASYWKWKMVSKVPVEERNNWIQFKC